MKTQGSPGNAKQQPRPVVTPSMALQVLKTALDYVRDSGLRVQIGNRQGLCVMVVAGALWDGDAQMLRVVGGDAQGGDAHPETDAQSAEVAG